MQYPARPAALALLAAIGVALAAFEAAAQAYPARPIRLIVPFAPGGAADVPGRVLASKLSEALRQQVVIDNRPGAGGTIGADLAAKAAPDGYTLLLISSTHLVSATLHSKRIQYDAINDFAQITEFGSAPNVLAVHPSLPAKSVKQLISLARAQPGKIDFASSGNGGSQHLFGALFISMAGIKLTHVPYKGSATAAADLVAGQVPVGFPGIAVALPHVKSGRLRALGVTGAKRSVAMPDVPTIAEAGVPGYEATLWLGLAAPRNTPRDIIIKLHGESVKALKLPELQKTFLASGTEVSYQETPEQFTAYVKSEAVKWAKVVQLSGAQVN